MTEETKDGTIGEMVWFYMGLTSCILAENIFFASFFFSDTDHMHYENVLDPILLAKLS